MTFLRRLSVLLIAVLLVFTVIWHSNRVDAAVSELTELVDNIEKDPTQQNVDELKNAWSVHQSLLACTYKHDCLNDITVKIHLLTPRLIHERGSLYSTLCEIRLGLEDLRASQSISLGNLL